MRAASMTAIAAMILGAFAAPVTVNPFPGWEPEQRISEEHKQWMNLVSHNVSEFQIAIATHSKEGNPISLTHAQMDAIVAADEDPDRPLDYEYDGNLATLNRDPTDRQHMEQIYRVMDANLSRDEIHDLFHSKAGRPIKITNAEVDSAIITHAATAPAKAKSDKNFEDSLPRTTEAEANNKHLELYRYNVSWFQSMAATHKKDGGGSALTEAQEQAIVAADKDPFLPLYEDNDYYYDSERHRIKQILTTLNAGMSLGQIHKLFHSQGGKPIRVSDEEVESAIIVHAAAAAKLTEHDRIHVSDNERKTDTSVAIAARAVAAGRTSVLSPKFDEFRPCEGLRECWPTLEEMSH